MKCICPTRDAELDYADRFMNFLNRFNENWHTLGSDSLNSIPNWIHSIHDVKGRFRAHGAQISALLALVTVTLRITMNDSITTPTCSAAAETERPLFNSCSAL